MAKVVHDIEAKVDEGGIPHSRHSEVRAFVSDFFNDILDDIDEDYSDYLLTAYDKLESIEVPEWRVFFSDWLSIELIVKDVTDKSKLPINLNKEVYKLLESGRNEVQVRNATRFLLLFVYIVNSNIESLFDPSVEEKGDAIKKMLVVDELVEKKGDIIKKMLSGILSLGDIGHDFSKKVELIRGVINGAERTGKEVDELNELLNREKIISNGEVIFAHSPENNEEQKYMYLSKNQRARMILNELMKINENADRESSEVADKRNTSEVSQVKVKPLIKSMIEKWRDIGVKGAGDGAIFEILKSVMRPYPKIAERYVLIIDAARESGLDDSSDFVQLVNRAKEEKISELVNEFSKDSDKDKIRKGIEGKIELLRRGHSNIEHLNIERSNSVGSDEVSLSEHGSVASSLHSGSSSPKDKNEPNPDGKNKKSSSIFSALSKSIFSVFRRKKKSKPNSKQNSKPNEESYTTNVQSECENHAKDMNQLSGISESAKSNSSKHATQQKNRISLTDSGASDLSTSSHARDSSNEYNTKEFRKSILGNGRKPVSELSSKSSATSKDGAAKLFENRKRAQLLQANKVSNRGVNKFGRSV